MTIKAISLWQPWATFVALGIKRFETRSWETGHRGLLAIHAAQRKNRDLKEFFYYISRNYEQAAGILRTAGFDTFEKLPFGCIVCTCNLTQDLMVYNGYTSQLSSLELAVGDFGLGRFAWKLDNVHPLSQPIPVRGSQGFFNVHIPDSYLPEIAA